MNIDKKIRVNQKAGKSDSKLEAQEQNVFSPGSNVLSLRSETTPLRLRELLPPILFPRGRPLSLSYRPGSRICDLKRQASSGRE